MADLNGVERNGAAPVAINNGHSRKGSMMGDAKKGSLAFGTVDSPNPLLSSSPAAPSVTRKHLADNVKSFGTIEADGTDPNSVKPPSRRTSGLNTPMSPPMQQKKSFDMHAGFKSQAPQQAPLQHQLQQQQPPMQPGMPFYRPAPNRSPNMGNAAPPYTNYRPQMPQQQVRPGMPPARPQFVPQGYPQQYMYTPQNYYVSFWQDLTDNSRPMATTNNSCSSSSNIGHLSRPILPLLRLPLSVRAQPLRNGPLKRPAHTCRVALPPLLLAKPPQSV